MTLATPYPAELVRVAKKVVWYDRPEATLADVPTFLTHVMVYGSPADVEVVERFMSSEEFRKVLENAPPGFSRKSYGDIGTKDSGCLCRPSHDADSRTDRLARRRADSSGASGRGTRRCTRRQPWLSAPDCYLSQPPAGC